MKLYFIELKDIEHDTYIYNLAFTSEKLAERKAWTIEYNSCMNARVRSIDLPFIGRTVCFVHADFGVAQSFDPAPMRENILFSKIYACADFAKKDELWMKGLSRMEQEPDERYHVTSNMIATDRFGRPFRWGDRDGFNISIRRIRVSKESC